MVGSGGGGSKKRERNPAEQFRRKMKEKEKQKNKEQRKKQRQEKDPMEPSTSSKPTKSADPPGAANKQQKEQTPSMLSSGAPPRPTGGTTAQQPPYPASSYPQFPPYTHAPPNLGAAVQGMPPPPPAPQGMQPPPPPPPPMYPPASSMPASGGAFAQPPPTFTGPMYTQTGTGEVSQAGSATTTEQSISEHGSSNGQRDGPSKKKAKAKIDPNLKAFVPPALKKRKEKQNETGSTGTQSSATNLSTTTAPTVNTRRLVANPDVGNTEESDDSGIATVECNTTSTDTGSFSIFSGPSSTVPSLFAGPFTNAGQTGDRSASSTVAKSTPSEKQTSSATDAYEKFMEELEELGAD
eukprot:gb/GECG01009051.1/.p1 GENE.gb/GECG01009051.1/~~gb/GECG01009051.1/.p1  ORF type:complete len:352 (+),score=65.27 gb/GECG01009051.1/:1-1056(+)